MSQPLLAPNGPITGKHLRDISAESDAAHPPCKKKAKTIAISLQNPEAAKTWMASLKTERQKFLYFGKKEKVPSVETLRSRVGIGRHAEIGDYAENEFTKWIAKGEELLSSGKLDIGKFLTVSATKLRDQVFRCQYEYVQSRASMKEGWEDIVGICSEIAKGNIGNQALSSEQIKKIQELQKKCSVERSSLKHIVEDKEGLKEDLAKLDKLAVRWNNIMRNFATMNLNNTSRASVVFYDFFKDRYFSVSKDQYCHDSVIEFYEAYSKIAGLYQVYVSTFIQSAENARSFYARGLEAFSLVEL